jgi:hypothetical protein
MIHQYDKKETLSPGYRYIDVQQIVYGTVLIQLPMHRTYSIGVIYRKTNICYKKCASHYLLCRKKSEILLKKRACQ